MNNQLKQQLLEALQNILDDAYGNKFIFSEYQKMIRKIKYIMKSISEQNLYVSMKCFSDFGFNYVEYSNKISPWNARTSPLITGDIKTREVDLIKEITSHDI